MCLSLFLVACLLQVFDSTSKLKELKTNHFCCIGLSNGCSMQGSAMPVQVPHIRPGSHLESWSLVKMQLHLEGSESFYDKNLTSSKSFAQSMAPTEAVA